MGVIRQGGPSSAQGMTKLEPIKDGAPSDSMPQEGESQGWAPSIMRSGEETKTRPEAQHPSEVEPGSGTNGPKMGRN